MSSPPVIRIIYSSSCGLTSKPEEQIIGAVNLFSFHLFFIISLLLVSCSSISLFLSPKNVTRLFSLLWSLSNDQPCHRIRPVIQVVYQERAVCQCERVMWKVRVSLSERGFLCCTSRVSFPSLLVHGDLKQYMKLSSETNELIYCELHRTSCHSLRLQSFVKNLTSSNFACWLSGITWARKHVLSLFPFEMSYFSGGRNIVSREVERARHLKIMLSTCFAVETQPIGETELSEQGAQWQSMMTNESRGAEEARNRGPFGCICNFS